MKKALTVILAGAITLLGSWALSADIDGDWGMTLTAPEGSTFITMTISVDGENATATSDGSEISGSYKDGKLELEGKLYLADGGYAADTLMRARLDGQKLKGTMNWDSFVLDIDGSRQ